MGGDATDTHAQLSTLLHHSVCSVCTAVYTRRRAKYTSHAMKQNVLAATAPSGS